jgi:flagellar L-ring protein FlgH
MNNRSWSIYNGILIAIVLLILRAVAARGESLWRDAGPPSMFADKRATAIGDVLTILVQESNTSSKDNSTKTAKQAAVDASIDTFMYSPGASSLFTKGGQLPALKYSMTGNFDGGGKINNSERITARIAVRVIDVLPNRNLVIEGTRETSFGGETQTAVLRGVVRTEDVAANNTIFSYNVADATISYVSKGVVSDSQRKGWFTRIWDKITPF